MTALTAAQLAVQEKLLADLQAVGQTYGDPAAILRFMNDLAAAKAAGIATAALNTILQGYETYIKAMVDTLFQVNSFSNSNSTYVDPATAGNLTTAQWQAQILVDQASDVAWLNKLKTDFSGITSVTNAANWWTASNNNQVNLFRRWTTDMTGQNRIWKQNNDNNIIEGTALIEKSANGYWLFSIGQSTPQSTPHTNDGVVLNWADQKDLITLLISNGQKSANTTDIANPFANLSAAVSNAIRTFYTNQIAKTSLAGAFVLLTVMFDKINANQQAGLSISTELLNKVTNSIATPLLNLIQKLGTDGYVMSKKEADQFAEMVWLTKKLAKVSPQLSSIADSLNKAIDSMRDLKIYVPANPLYIVKTTYEVTLGQMLDLLSVKRGNIVTVVTTLPTTDDSVVPTDAQLKAGTDAATLEQLRWGLSGLSTNQTLINAAQQIGALFTGVSKQVSTNFSIVANELNQILQLGSSVTSHSSGYQSMISSMIRAQRA